MTQYPSCVAIQDPINFALQQPYQVEQPEKLQSALSRLKIHFHSDDNKQDADQESKPR